LLVVEAVAEKPLPVVLAAVVVVLVAI